MYSLLMYSLQNDSRGADRPICSNMVNASLFRMSEGSCRPGLREEEAEGGRRNDAWSHAHGSPHREKMKRMALLEKLAFEGSGPCDGSSSFSRMMFAWILTQWFTYQFTPKVVTWLAF